jgi:predicted nuclease with TOPRIM domain
MEQEVMIDIRIAADPERVEVLSKVLRDSSFVDIGVSVSSIMPTTDASVVRKAAKGADILLMTARNMKGDVSDLPVGHVEYVKLPEKDDAVKIQKALRDGVIRSAMYCITIVSDYNEIKEEIENFRQKDQEYQDMRNEYAELKEKKIYLEKLVEGSERLKQKIQDLENELRIIRKEQHDYDGIEVKDLFSFPLEELWREIAGTPPPRNEDIDVAIKRLNLEGNIMVSCGYLAAPSREEAVDMLRIVKITQDLQKRKVHQKH